MYAVNGAWLISYIALWAIVATLIALTIGTLQQLATRSGEAPKRERDTVVSVERDGPQVGSYLPSIRAATINEHGFVDTGSVDGNAETVLLFMSPRCATCQAIVEPINRVVKDRAGALQIIVILRADDTEGCINFLRVFEMKCPVICDADRQISTALAVEHNPLGFFYSQDRMLTRKGAVVSASGLLALVGDELAPAADASRMITRKVIG